MKLCIIVCIMLAFNSVYGGWADRVYLVDAMNYFYEVMQETILELERRGFCSLELADITQSISQQMYKWHVQGNITYTNGYLVSVQKIDVTNFVEQIDRRTVDGVTQISGSVQGRLNIRDMKIGYDVLAQLGEDGDHRFTGTFVHTLTTFQFWILKNLHTQEISVSHSLMSLSGGLTRMDYMPANNITQVISRTYTAGNIFTSVNNWGHDVILPIILDIAKNKIKYPRVCLDCR